MIPTVIKGSNITLGRPSDMTDDECGSLAAKLETHPRGMRTLSSAWLPSAEELQRLNEGKPVILTVFGVGHPPVAVGVEK